MSAAKLPDSWIEVTLGEITEPIEKVLPAKEPKKEIRYLDISGIDNASNRVTEVRTYTGATAPSRARQLVKEGDVLFSTVRTYLKNIARVPTEYDGQVASTGFSVLRPSKGILSEYLFSYTLTPILLEPLAALQRGSSYPAVREQDVRSQIIPLPPLAEQKRIVAKIEGLFSELDAGEESLRRARRQLGVYRQSLLKQAFEGKLTAPWRAQHPDLLESPDQLLARIQAELEARYEKQLKEWEKAGKGHGKPKPPTTVEPILAKRLAQLPELPEGWIWQTIENLVDHGRSCAYGVLQPGPHVETGVPLVRVGDIQNGRVSTVEMKRISPKIAGQYRRTELRGGEFLISLVGAIGRTAVAQHELRGANTARAVGVVPLSEAINPHFVEVCFRSPAKLAEMVSQANEVARKTLNLEDVRKATVPLCSLPEQQEIVRLLDAQFEVIEQNEREIDAALKRSEALRQSILKKAFTGQLVPQDPTDEPASELLARIRGEREDADAIQPKATKKATAR